MDTLGQHAGAAIVELPYGCILLKSWLSVAEQKQLMDCSLGLAAEANAEWLKSATSQEHPYIVCSYDKNPPPRAKDCVRACGLRACTGACGRPSCKQEPTLLYSLADDAIARARKVADCGGVQLPEKFCPDTVWGLIYKEEDCMPSHLDRAEGWVLSISVGATVKFVVGRKPQKGSTYGEYAPHKPVPGQVEQTVLVKSGDMLLFRGDTVFHAVDGICPGTAPEFWTNEMHGTGGLARIGLLFRDGH